MLFERQCLNLLHSCSPATSMSNFEKDFVHSIMSRCCPMLELHAPLLLSYFHGVYSHVRMTSSQYIEEDVLWKETGYLHCDDVWFVSALYYSMMAFFAVFALVSLIGTVVAFAGSACSTQVRHREVFKLTLEQTFEMNANVSTRF